MPDIYLIKVSDEILIPVNEEDKAKIAKLKKGDIIKVSYSKIRNAGFHRKFFALIDLAYENWEPEKEKPRRVKIWLPTWKGIKFFGYGEPVDPLDTIINKSPERFRKDLTILAGYYEAYYRIDGSVRLEAESIAFANMKQEKFDSLYNAVANVVLKKFCIMYNRQELDRVVLERMERFF